VCGLAPDAAVLIAATARQHSADVVAVGFLIAGAAVALALGIGAGRQVRIVDGFGWGEVSVRFNQQRLATGEGDTLA
jgi:hypothetical protein